MDLNRQFIIGNVGQDPQYHTMGNGNELAKFSVATTRSWKDKQTGEWQQDTQWHNIVVFNAYCVGVVREKVQKGTRVFIEGETKTRTYESNGQTRYITEVLVPSVGGNIMPLARIKGDEQKKESGGSPATNPYDAPYDDDIPF